MILEQAVLHFHIGPVPANHRAGPDDSVSAWSSVRLVGPLTTNSRSGVSENLEPVEQTVRLALGPRWASVSSCQHRDSHAILGRSGSCSGPRFLRLQNGHENSPDNLRNRSEFPESRDSSSPAHLAWNPVHAR